MARRGGIDEYLEDRRRQLERAGEFIRRFNPLGPQATTRTTPRRDTRRGDSGVRINPKNVQVTRTGLERRKRTSDQRSTRGYGGRSRY